MSLSLLKRPYFAGRVATQTFDRKCSGVRPRPTSLAVPKPRHISAPLIAAYAVARVADALRSRRRRRQSPLAEQLSSTVSFTSRLIAAYRALESQEADAVFVDPLAPGFAGRAAMKKASRHSTEEYDAVQPGKYNLPPVDDDRPRRLGTFTIRTLYFDKALTAACRGEAIADGLNLSPIRQVVMLGAGMDARPWRLDLPDAVRWFEVDKEDVLTAKKAVLQELCAALTAADNSSAWFPLKAAELHMVTADLVTPGWTQTLIDQGFDPEQPTVWHAEGLLNYLTAGQIQTMLGDARKVSAPGSLLMSTMISASHTAAQRAGTHESDAQEIAQIRKWGAPKSTAKIKEFFEGCQWQAVQLNEVAQIAPQTAPGFEYNCGALHKQDHDFQYWFMLAQPSREQL